MATSIVHDNVIGSSFTNSQHDYSRSRATRKLIIKSTETTRVAIIAALTANTCPSSSSCTTLLGPRLVADYDGDGSNDANAAHAIIHPDKGDLPLQTINIATLGDERFLVTLEYFVTPITWGGGGTTPQTMSLRTEFAAKRLYQNGFPVQLPSSCSEEYLFRLALGLLETETIVSHSIVTTVPQLKIRLPFYAINPPSIDGPMRFLGGINEQPVKLLEAEGHFQPQTLRFDGIVMDEFGSLATSGTDTYRYKGHYEFSARADGFAEHVATWCANEKFWGVNWGYPSVDEEATWCNLCDLNMPGWTGNCSACAPG